MGQPWIAALGATLLMQAIASFMMHSLPVIAPMLTGAVGLAPEAIGNLSSINAFGTVLFLAFGGPVLARLGPIRMLQAGAMLSAFGLLTIALGAVPALGIAALLLRIGYGPTPPGGWQRAGRGRRGGRAAAGRGWRIAKRPNSLTSRP